MKTEKMMLSHYAGCRFARLAGNPKKIVISDGNDIKKPGDLVATCTDEELAEELVHLWNEGIQGISIGKQTIEPIDEEEHEERETTPDIEAFIDDIRNTLEGREGKPTRDTLTLVASVIHPHEDILEVLEEAGLIGSIEAPTILRSEHEDPLSAAREHMEKQQEDMMKQAEEKLERLLKESVEEGLLNNITLIKLFTRSFRDELALIEKLNGKLGDEDNDLKKILAHVRNTIVTEKNRGDG